MNYFKLSFAICISLLLLSCNNQKQNKELSAERRMLDTFFMQAQYYNDDYPDETITLSPKDTNSNEYIERTFYIDVGVTDLSSYLKDSAFTNNKIPLLFILNNIRDLECTILYQNKSFNNYCHFPSEFDYRKFSLNFEEIKSGEIIHESFPECRVLSNLKISIDSNDIKKENISLNSFRSGSYKLKYQKSNSNQIINIDPLILSENHFKPIRGCEDFKRFRVVVRLPKVFSNYDIIFNSRTNSIVRVINCFPVTNNNIRIGDYYYPYQPFLEYYQNILSEISELGLQQLNINFADSTMIDKIARYIDNSEKFYDRLPSYKKEKLGHSYSLYRELTWNYIKYYYPKFFKGVFSSANMRFNIRIAER